MNKNLKKWVIPKGLTISYTTNVAVKLLTINETTIYERPPFVKQFFFRNLLLGLACNEYTKEMSLDLSSNSLGAQGAHVLESCVHGVRCISSLDISDNSKYLLR